jgi:hypothetical protein
VLHPRSQPQERQGLRPTVRKIYSDGPDEEFAAKSVKPALHSPQKLVGAPAGTVYGPELRGRQGLRRLWFSLSGDETSPSVSMTRRGTGH